MAQMEYKKPATTPDLSAFTLKAEEMGLSEGMTQRIIDILRRDGWREDAAIRELQYFGGCDDPEEFFGRGIDCTRYE